MKMKKIKIIIFVLVLLVTASLAKAQIVVSSTTASTTQIKKEHIKSERVKGLVIRPEVDLGFGIMQDLLLLGFNGTVDYQFNPYFAIGGGLGFYYDHDFYHTYLSRPTWVPIFINMRAYFCDRKWSPFIDLKIGSNIPITKGIWQYTLKIHGFTLGGTIGIQYKGFDMGFTYQRAKMLEIAEFQHEIFQHERREDLFTINVAYNFQFGKK